MPNCSEVSPSELQERHREPSQKQRVAGREVYGRKQGEPSQSGHYLIFQAKHYPRMVMQFLAS